MEILRLPGTGRANNWKEYPHRFEILIKAISESGIKKSLISVNLWICKLDKEYCKSILNSFGMREVEIDIC